MREIDGRSQCERGSRENTTMGKGHMAIELERKTSRMLLEWCTDLLR
jgi:hypothetical protein